MLATAISRRPGSLAKLITALSSAGASTIVESLSYSTGDIAVDIFSLDPSTSDSLLPFIDKQIASALSGTPAPPSPLDSIIGQAASTSSPHPSAACALTTETAWRAPTAPPAMRNPLEAFVGSSQFDKLKLNDLLTEGKTSNVWRGKWGEVHVVVKVLRVNPASLEKKGVLKSFLQEARILGTLRHPTICTFHGTCMKQGFPAIVLEYLSGGSLFDLLHNSSTRKHKHAITPALLSRISLEVATGIRYLHEHAIIHRDIKSSTVLLDDGCHVKLAGFGLSTQFGPDLTAETGTYRFMAPEVTIHEKYDCSCDVFSYAILLWEVMHRKVPFMGESPTGENLTGLQAAFAVAIEKRRPQIELQAPLDIFTPIIRRCWAHEPSDRPPMSEVAAELATLNAKVKNTCPSPSPPDGGELGGEPVSEPGGGDK